MHDLLFYSQHMIQELENPIVLETLIFLPIPYFLVTNSVWFTFLCQYLIQELKNARSLDHEKKISNISSILPILELVVWVSHHHQVYVLLKISAKVTCYCNCSHSFVSLCFSSSFPYWVFQFLLIFAPSLFLFPFFSFFCCSFFLRFFLFFSFYFNLSNWPAPHGQGFPLIAALVTETYKYVG